MIIKNLEYDEREKYDSNATLHKVQALLKDGLAIPNIKIRKASHKNGSDRYNGVVVVRLDEIGQKKVIQRTSQPIGKCTLTIIYPLRQECFRVTSELSLRKLENKIKWCSSETSSSINVTRTDCGVEYGTVADGR